MLDCLPLSNSRDQAQINQPDLSAEKMAQLRIRFIDFSTARHLLRFFHTYGSQD